MRLLKLVAAIAALTQTAALADTPVPHQKPGLWETTMTMAGRPFTSQSCVTPESEAKVSIFSSQLRRTNCLSNSISHGLDGSWNSTSTCKEPNGGTRTTHVHVSGDFNSKVIMVMTVEGKSAPETTMTMTWMGACKPGMKGGDVIMNGMKMNVLDNTASGMPSH
jgi:hypothetical protein